MQWFCLFAQGGEWHRGKCNFPAPERKWGEFIFLIHLLTSFLILILKKRCPGLTEPMIKPDRAKFCPWDVTPKFTKDCSFGDQAGSTEHVHRVRGRLRSALPCESLYQANESWDSSCCNLSWIISIFDSPFVCVSPWDIDLHCSSYDSQNIQSIKHWKKLDLDRSPHHLLIWVKYASGKNES